MRRRVQTSHSRRSPSLCDRADEWLPCIAASVDDRERRSGSANGRSSATLVSRCGSCAASLMPRAYLHCLRRERLARLEAMKGTEARWRQTDLLELAMTALS